MRIGRSIPWACGTAETIGDGGTHAYLWRQVGYRDGAAELIDLPQQGI